MTEQYVLDLRDVSGSDAAIVGGKGAHLGELSRIDGVRVPPGFCVTTHAFRKTVGTGIDDQLAELSRLAADDRDEIRTLSAEIRRLIEAMPIPDEVTAAVTGAMKGRTACAVRSSATAEDLPTASFAGQQDSYLNVVGTAAVLEHLRRCWASLFTERAVAYRLENGFDQRTVHMAVVVQEMVFAQAAGVMFTADPVTGNRRVVAVDASFGLGEALVSGLVNPDAYQVRDGRIIARQVAAKKSAVRALSGGGTEVQAVGAEQQERAALTDEQVVRLAELGRRIEAHFGRPQDIEWCWNAAGNNDARAGSNDGRAGNDDSGAGNDDSGEFRIVQSRPITTLFPVPESGDGGNHVYLSVGHQQMMTDPMKPLGISMWQLTAMAPMVEAGGRLFVDAARGLATPAGRRHLLELMGRSDPLTRDAIETLLDRGDFIATLPDHHPADHNPAGHNSDDQSSAPAGKPPAPLPTDPAIVAELIEHSRETTEALRRDIQGKTGPALFDFLVEAFAEHKRILGEPRNIQAIMAGMDATWWLNDRLQEWLGEKNAADTLTLSAPGNITSAMGLELLDVADVIRPHPAVVAFLQSVTDDDFLEELPKVAGGVEARDAIEAYLDKYGMRCAGEIDITRPRWRERPSTLVPAILDNVRNFEAGAAARRFEQGRLQAEAKENEVLARLRELPDGQEKAAQTKRMIDRVRTYIGYREYPKYNIISRYFVYKQALREEAARLVRDGVLAEEEDVYYLTFPELADVARTHEADGELIRRRKEAFQAYGRLSTPRVLTSDGEVVTGAYRRDDVPAGAFVGLPVSPGVVEGRARVVLDMAQADLEAGDILVTTFTDPSWSPLFVGVAGLVTEVGGLMTHGAVIAREYGLPAVVGVDGATRLIRDGQRIRVHGADGYVEILP